MSEVHSVLVIDDEIDICESIADVISDDVGEVVTVQSVKEALKILDKKSFHLVISDILMPDMDGIELLKLLRQRRYKYPIIFISASDSDVLLAKALEYGVMDFVSKPFDSKELAALVKRLLATVDMAGS
jgi:DNA-binding response OmpR family regulator